MPNNADENFDNDEDGIGDNKDPDDDNDGSLDTDEIINGTDPNDPIQTMTDQTMEKNLNEIPIH